MKETRVGIRELKAQLSHCLREVKAGGTVVITERGKPVGRIIPEASSLEEKLQQLVDSRMLAWNGRKLPPEVLAVSLSGNQTVSDLLLEDRD